MYALTESDFHSPTDSPARLAAHIRHTRGWLSTLSCASVTALTITLAAGDAAGQACSFQEGDLYFNQTGSNNPGASPCNAIGLARLDPHFCSPTTISPGFDVRSIPGASARLHAKYDPFRNAIAGLGHSSCGGVFGTMLFYCDGTTSAWNVTATLQDNMKALAPRGDGIVYAVSYWLPTSQYLLGYVDQGDVFHPLLDPVGALVDIPIGSTADARDLMYSPTTNSLVYITRLDTNEPCGPAQGLKVWWIDLDPAGTGLASPPLIEYFPECGADVTIFTRMARTPDDTFVFFQLTTDTRIAKWEFVELDPVTKQRGLFAYMANVSCATTPVPFVGSGLAFDRVTQQAIMPMYRYMCGFGVNSIELRGFTRSPTASEGSLVCAFPYTNDPNDAIPSLPWGVNDMFDISSPALGGVGFCFGDGSGTNCPCFPTIPAGAAGNGCPNSVNPSGAHLSAIGLARLSADSIVLNASGMPASTTLYFQGTSSGSGVVFGDGVSCVGGSLIRLRTVLNDASGASHYPSAGELAVSVKGLVTTPGHRYYQAQYRNSAPSFCTPSTFNATNGVDVTWVP